MSLNAPMRTVFQTVLLVRAVHTYDCAQTVAVSQTWPVLPSLTSKTVTETSRGQASKKINEERERHEKQHEKQCNWQITCCLSECFMLVVFRSTNKNTYTSAQPCRKLEMETARWPCCQISIGFAPNNCPKVAAQKHPQHSGRWAENSLLLAVSLIRITPFTVSAGKIVLVERSIWRGFEAELAIQKTCSFIHCCLFFLLALCLCFFRDWAYHFPPQRMKKAKESSCVTVHATMCETRTECGYRSLKQLTSHVIVSKVNGC